MTESFAAPVPFFSDQGQGDPVVCLHSNASSSSQWRSLASLLAERFRVFAVDGYGAGKSPDWPAAMPARFDEEVRLLEAVFVRAGGPVHLVGHSYGAAVALQAAIRFPDRVRSVVAYEPTLFSLVAGSDPERSPVAGIWRAAGDAAAAVERGDNVAAARRFVDFWMTEGAYAAMPPVRQAAVAHAVRHVGRWRDATFGAAATVAALARLRFPVLLMHGARSPESPLSVARLLATTLPEVTSAPQPGLGHMGPITHPDRVNAQIAAFLHRP